MSADVVCPACGEIGPHFVPPSMGEPGFYHCQSPSPSGDREVVVASVPWSCDTCGKSDVLNLAVIPDVLGLLGRLKRMHREASPGCPRELPVDHQQIEVPEGAVVNDPYETRSEHVLSAALVQPLPKIASASNVPRSGRLKVPFFAATGPSSDGKPVRDVSREQRSAAKLARREAALARAEAKRESKAARRADNARAIERGRDRALELLAIQSGILRETHEWMKQRASLRTRNAGSQQ